MKFDNLSYNFRLEKRKFKRCFLFLKIAKKRENIIIISEIAIIKNNNKIILIKDNLRYSIIIRFLL